MRAQLQNEDEIGFLNDDKARITEHLAHRLRQSEMGLLLGAGISSGFDFPMWEELVKICCEKSGITDHGIMIDPASGIANPSVERSQLLKLMGRVRRSLGNEEKYHNLLYDVLYNSKDVLNKIKNSPLSVLQNPLLLAIGSLISGSANGKVSEIITYNFDGLLEWYLGLHGFKHNTIQSIPCLMNNSDVNICHPHGFLPLSSTHWEKSDFIIFDKKSYNERLDPVNPSPWWRFLEYLLNAKQWLFLGIGEDDPTLGPLLEGIKKNLTNASHSNRKITGFWAFKSDRKSSDHVATINDYGCVPLYFDDFSEIPEFLLRIRQLAAEMVLS